MLTTGWVDNKPRGVFALPVQGKGHLIRTVSTIALPVLYGGLHVAAKRFSACAYSPFLRGIGQCVCFVLESEASREDVLEDAEHSRRRCETLLLMLEMYDAAMWDATLGEVNKIQVRIPHTYGFGV